MCIAYLLCFFSTPEFYNCNCLLMLLNKFKVSSYKLPPSPVSGGLLFICLCAFIAQWAVLPVELFLCHVF